MTTVRCIMKMDQGWTVPSIIGVEINKNIRQDSMVLFQKLICLFSAHIPLFI